VCVPECMRELVCIYVSALEDLSIISCSDFFFVSYICAYIQPCMTSRERSSIGGNPAPYLQGFKHLNAGYLLR